MYTKTRNKCLLKIVGHVLKNDVGVDKTCELSVDLRKVTSLIHDKFNLHRVGSNKTSLQRDHARRDMHPYSGAGALREDAGKSACSASKIEEACFRRLKIYGLADEQPISVSSL